MKARRPDIGLAVEYAFMAAIIVGLAYNFWFFVENHYLPQPFFYDLGDTWMDWFNPAYWAHQPGAYDTFRSIYPPLSFVLLKFLTYGPCYVGNEGGLPRECDIYGVISLHLVYLIDVALTAKLMFKIDRRTAIPRTIAMAIGLPMLWALDRGNLVLITYMFVLLAYGPLVRSARLRWVFAAMAINLKVYLIGTLFAQLIHRRWRWAEGALLMTVAVYLLSFVMFGVGSPAAIYNNIALFAEQLEVNNPLDLWLASSLKPMTSLLQSTKYPTILYVGSNVVETASAALPWITRGAQAIIIAAALAAAWKPEAVPRTRMIALSIGIAILTTEVSAYTQILVFLFVFMEPFTGLARRYAILLAYLLSIPADINIDRLGPMVAESFLGGRPVFVEYTIQVGPFIRPLLTMSIPVALALLTLNEVWKYHCRKAVPQSARLAPLPA